MLVSVLTNSFMSITSRASEEYQYVSRNSLPDVF
jgi:hypothetical protein